MLMVCRITSTRQDAGVIMRVKIKLRNSENDPTHSLQVFCIFGKRQNGKVHFLANANRRTAAASERLLHSFIVVQYQWR
jgi:hypothetical protein